MSEKILKPCPFCLGQPDIHYEPSRDCLSIFCLTCGVEMESREIGEVSTEICERWNQRGEPPRDSTE